MRDTTKSQKRDSSNKDLNLEEWPKFIPYEEWHKFITYEEWPKFIPYEEWPRSFFRNLENISK